MPQYVRWNGQWVEITNTTGGGGDYTLPNSVVHNWRFDEGSGITVSDSVGSANGSINGSAGWITGTWIGDAALSFDGSDDSVEIDSNRTEVGDTGTFVVTAEFNAINSTHYIGLNDDSNNGQRMYLRSEGDGEIRVGIGDSAPLTGFVATTGTKYRFALTWDTGSYSLYINGTEEDVGTYSGSVTVNSRTEWFFGRTRSGVSDPDWFDGNLDNAILADEAYTSQQVTDDYNNQPWS
jgi:hypothetical protein